MNKSITQANQNDKQISKSIKRFFIRFHISSALKASNAYKKKGIPVVEVFQYLFWLIFSNRSMYMSLITGRNTPGFAKDTVYRFMKMIQINWIRFTTLLASRIIKDAILPLDSKERTNVLIIDDSMFERNRSKKVELLAKAYDHANHRYRFGFRMLTLGWSDGSTFLPVNSVLLSSEKTQAVKISCQFLYVSLKYFLYLRHVGVCVMYRVEDKYICNDLEMEMLQARIGTVLKPDHNQYDSNGYSIISLYFDDVFNTHLQDTINGNSFRDKYRIRIYNNSFSTIKLEVKSKEYNRIYKRSRNITYAQMEQLLLGNYIEDEHSLDDPSTLFNIAIKQRGLSPKIIIAYERKAYVFGPGNVRITFDRNIRSSEQIEAFGNSHLSYNQLHYPNNSILEVKYDEFMPNFIAQILELGNMQQTSYSKYRLCRENTIRGEKTNVSKRCY